MPSIISRRKFIGLAGCIASGLALTMTSPEKPFSFTSDANSEEPKKTAPLVEILDDRYQYKFLAEGLMRPGNIALCPATKQFFFTQMGQYEFSKGHDLTDPDFQYRLWKKYGEDEDVFELVNGKPAYVFAGSMNPWGSHSPVRIGTNLKDEIMIYEKTPISQSIRVFNLKTKKLKIIIDKADLEGKLGFGISDILINPADNRVYFAHAKWLEKNSNVIYSLDTSSGNITEWFKTSPITNWDGLGSGGDSCFDSNGNFYTTSISRDFLGGNSEKSYVVKISRNKKIEIIEVSKPPRIMNNNFSDNTSFDNSSGKMILGGSCWAEKSPHTKLDNYIIETDLGTKESSTIAKIRGGERVQEPFSIKGLYADKGVIYVSISPDIGYYLNIKRPDLGKIIKISRK